MGEHHIYRPNTPLIFLNVVDEHERFCGLRVGYAPQPGQDNSHTVSCAYLRSIAIEIGNAHAVELQPDGSPARFRITRDGLEPLLDVNQTAQLAETPRG